MTACDRDSVLDGVRDSQRAWVGHGEFHDDSPPRRLAPGLPTWDGEAFQETTEKGDDWLYDDPWLKGPPAEDLDVVYDSRDGVPS